MIDQRQSGRGASAKKGLVGILLEVVFLVVNMYIASRRRFWHDKIGTVLVTRLPSDFLPVAHAMVQVSAGPFGPTEFAAGLPR
ncbi:MAG TPA: hypothetical protein VNY05_25400 [Candidatus Acidoferrales bacterium]|jgi:hypothetical protein|nr:hypothetical protein [Candidatus Acidoferrales bacterium]